MTTTYPGAIDSYSTKVDFVDLVEAEDVNDLQDAIVALENTLGREGNPVFEGYLGLNGNDTLRLDALGGGRVALYDGNAWNTHIITSPIDKMLASVKIWELYDVYLFDNAGSLELHLEEWDREEFTITGIDNSTPRTVTTASVDPLIANNAICYMIVTGGAGTELNGQWKIDNVAGTTTFQLRGSRAGTAYGGGGATGIILSSTPPARATIDGVLVLDSDNTYRYVGTVLKKLIAQTADSVSQRFVWNYYNRRVKHLLRNDTTSHTYTTAEARPYRYIIGNKVEFVTGVVEESVLMGLRAKLAFLVGDGAVNVALIGNDTGGGSPECQVDLGDVGTLTLSDKAAFTPQLGYNFLQLMQTGATTSPDFVNARAAGLLRC